jgi:hypothetical protein
LGVCETIAYFDWLIDWCLTPTLAICQLYRSLFWISCLGPLVVLLPTVHDTFSASDYQFGTPKHLLHVYIECKEFLKILKMWPETVNRWRTDNIMAKKRQTMTKRALHRKLKIGQNITPHKTVWIKANLNKSFWCYISDLDTRECICQGRKAWMPSICACL